LLHNDARYFQQPHQFLPERFMGSRPSVTFGLTYLPFGAGRRACVGNHLALQQMSLITLLLARRFKVNSIIDCG
jgi:cytochrome P450